MEKFSKFVVKHKILITVLIAVLSIVALVCMFFVNINSDIISYLPEDMQTSEGYAFLQKTFNMESDAIIAVKTKDYDTVKQIADKIQALDGVRANGVNWYGTLDQMKDMDLGAVGDKFDLDAMIEEIKNRPDILKLFRPTEDIYTIMIQMTYSSSSNEAGKVLSNCKKIIKDYGIEYAVGGSSEIATSLLSTVVSEMPYYLVIAVIIVILILVCTTNSLFEPVILITTLAISILLNMGTNIIFPNISIITFATSAILQLALSMDYSIFLMHAFREERAKCFDDYTAMQRAIPKTFSTICASSMTTIGGFLALLFMQFEVGADLGLVLAKGVLMSLLTVILLQPCLILYSKNVTKKLEHPVKLPKFQKSAEFVVKRRKPILWITLLLVVPIIFCGTSISYSYMKMDKNQSEMSDVEQVVQVMGNSVLICAPNDKGEQHLNFIEDVKEIENVSVVSSIYAMAPERYADLLSLLIKLDLPQLEAYANDGYVLYTVMIETESESQEEQVLLKELRGVLQNYFGEDFYITGMAQAVNDLAVITPKDFALVSIVSALIILVILLLTIKSFKYSIALMGVVELGIFVNLGICYLMKTPVNFMAYIIISSVQMGATVDYAILQTMKFKSNMATMPKKDACVKAVKDSTLSILTSALILGCLCFAVNLICSNAIIAQVTMLIGRGALISAGLILFVLPSVLLAITNKMPKNQSYAKMLKQKLHKKRNKNKQPEQEIIVWKIIVCLKYLIVK